MTSVTTHILPQGQLNVVCDGSVTDGVSVADAMGERGLLLCPGYPILFKTVALQSRRVTKSVRVKQLN